LQRVYPIAAVMAVRIVRIRPGSHLTERRLTLISSANARRLVDGGGLRTGTSRRRSTPVGSDPGSLVVPEKSAESGADPIPAGNVPLRASPSAEHPGGRRREHGRWRPDLAPAICCATCGYVRTGLYGIRIASWCELVHITNGAAESLAPGRTPAPVLAARPAGCLTGREARKRNISCRNRGPHQIRRDFSRTTRLPGSDPHGSRSAGAGGAKYGPTHRRAVGRLADEIRSLAQ